jgi:heme exporter protein D
MNWSSFADFADMGGYGLYVWGSYLMTAVALGWEATMLAQRRRRALEDARAQAGLQGLP